MKNFQDILSASKEALNEQNNKNITIDKIVLTLELTESYLGRKLNKNEIANFTDIILESDEIIAKKKDDGTVFKKGKYTIEIMTSEGKLIRTATSQKGILDVIHGERSYRVLDGNNRDITAKLKTFIKQKQKQAQLKKKYAKKKKVTNEDVYNLNNSFLLENRPPPGGGLKKLFAKLFLAGRMAVPSTAVPAPQVQIEPISPKVVSSTPSSGAPRISSSSTPTHRIIQGEPTLVKVSEAPKPVSTAEPVAVARASTLLPPTPAASTLRPFSSEIPSNTNSPIEAREPVKAPIKANEPIKASIEANEPVKAPIEANEPVKAPIEANEPVKAPIGGREPAITRTTTGIEEPVKNTRGEDYSTGGISSQLEPLSPVEATIEIKNPVNIFKKRQLGLFGLPTNY